MNPLNKSYLKKILGELPLAPEIYWYLRQPGAPVTAKFDLTRLKEQIPTWRAEAEASPYRTQPGKRVLLFGVQRYWVEHIALLGITLAGLGNEVTVAFAPYEAWYKDIDHFDARRQHQYALNILREMEPFVRITSFFRSNHNLPALPADVDQAIQQVALRDTQYTLQVEDVGTDNDLYRMRLERNRRAALAGYEWLRDNLYDVVLLPNGTILEMGALYQVALALKLPVVTYEFGEQHNRLWLAQNGEVMRQETNEMWQALKSQPLSDEQRQQVQQLFAARQRASLWENFARRWQGTPSAGGDQVRQKLQLDARPIALLATNVIGDSLTLGRQIFSDSMTEWIQRTVQFFAGQPHVQFVIRIHPGELVTKGPSVAGVVLRALSLPEDESGIAALPEHIHLVAADAQVNTYDIVEIADLGLVYTTTVGMEMAMSGLPVIVVGNTHYRAKGFTLDPESWDGYFELLSRALLQPAQFRPMRDQVEQAWHYAYRFFFNYPHPFPWHLLHLKDDLKAWPVERVLSEEGQLQFGKTFRYLTGETVRWA